MSDIDPNVERVLDLTESVCDEVAAPRDLEELDAILLEDGRSRQDYLDYYRMHVALRLQLRARRAAENVQRHINSQTVLPASGSLGEGTVHSPSTVPPTLLGNTVHGTVGYFSSGWPVAYLVATVIFGVGLLIGALVHVSEPAQVARQSTPLPSPPSTTHYPLSTTHSVVGRITGMVDCRWAEVGWVKRSAAPPEGGRQGESGSGTGNPQSLIPNPQSVVSLGDKFALSSGLMEITYDAGAKVILQGPATYEVESAAGGYLSVGKLTARVEKRSEIRDQRSDARKQKSPDLWPLTSDLFAIRTPTATVTDLGTEFGVEVSKEGSTTSHVFRGSVELRTIPVNDTTQPIARVLHENGWASVAKKPDSPHEDPQITLAPPSAATVAFVRDIPKQTIRTFDLVNVVAGGDGFSGRRNKGIDPTNGRSVDGQNIRGTPFSGDGQYHRVAEMPLVDGVFIPNGEKGAVQVDSAGHVCDGFPGTANTTWQYVWAGGELWEGVSSKIDEVDYASSGHGLLHLHANIAITFDLDAIRQANPGCKLLRFRSMAANNGDDANSYADIWVLIDGRKRFQRRQINGFHGGFSVVIPIDDKERFLTLAATDGGDGIHCDWITFGDPRLELTFDGAPTDLPQLPEAAER